MSWFATWLRTTHQTRPAEKFVDVCRREQEPIFLPILVLGELVWVLGRSYCYANADIVAALNQILETDLFVIENDGQSSPQYRGIRLRSGPLRDYVIGNIATCRMLWYGQVRSRPRRD
jgi:predicted nucleic-acid-binding protein